MVLDAGSRGSPSSIQSAIPLDGTSSSHPPVTPDPPDPGVYPVNAGVVMSEAMLDAIDYQSAPWATPYATLINTTNSIAISGVRSAMRFSGLTYNAHNPGAQIESDNDFNGELRMWMDDCEAAWIQALLYRVGDPSQQATRLAIVNDVIDSYKDVTSFAQDPSQSRRLASGWAIDNLTRAISMIGDEYDGRMDDFLIDVTYADDPLSGTRPDIFLDWYENPNWLGSFSAARLGIGVVTQRADIFENACDYWELRLAQNIYHASYDGGYVRQIDGSNSRTVRNWGGANGHAQIGSNRAAVFPAGQHMAGQSLPDGQFAEDWRDINHVMMGLGAFCHGALTMRHQGVEPSASALARLTAAYELHATRILEYLADGLPLEWFPYNGEGDRINGGWLPAVALLGNAVPTVQELIASDTDFSQPGVEYNHQSAEGFAFAAATI